MDGDGVLVRMKQAGGLGVMCYRKGPKYYMVKGPKCAETGHALQLYLCPLWGRLSSAPVCVVWYGSRNSKASVTTG